MFYMNLIYCPCFDKNLLNNIDCDEKKDEDKNDVKK